MDVAMRVVSGTSCAGSPSHESEVFGVAYSEAKQYLTVEFTVYVHGDYVLCAAPNGGKADDDFTHLFANVHITHTPATFDLGGVLPCALEFCEDVTSEKCMSFVAEYCMSHPDEAGCGLLMLMYVRNAGSEQKLSFAVPDLTARAKVRFAESGVPCGGAASKMIEVISATYTEAQHFLEITFIGPVAAKYHVCVSPYGELVDSAFSEHVTDVILVEDLVPCVFGGADGLTPCTSSECEDPTSEACMQFTAEYCANMVEDTGCEFIVPVFRRETGQVADVAIYSNAVPARGNVWVVLDTCSCADASCNVADVDVLASSFDVASHLSVVSVEPGTIAGSYAVCMSAKHAPDATAVHVATLEIVNSGSCAFSADAAPCSICAEDASSELCVQVAAAYCAERPEDSGCALFLPRFERVSGEEASLALLVPSLAPVHDVFVVDGSECSRGGLAVKWTEFEGSLTLSVTPHAGSFTICVLSSTDLVPVAALDTIGTQCAFGVNGPCESAACAGGNREGCMQVIAEYCASFPEDEGCALVLPIFKRVAGSPQRLDLFSKVPDLSTLRFTAVGDCSELSSAADVLSTSLEVASGRIHIDVLGRPARMQVCAGGEEIALVEFSAPSSAFRVEDCVPCASDACQEDPESEICLQVMGAYCVERPTDRACQFLLPVYERSAAAHESLHIAMAQPEFNAEVKIIGGGMGCFGTTELVLTSAVVGNSMKIDFFSPVAGVFDVCVDGAPVASLRVLEACVFGTEAGSPCELSVCSGDSYDAEICMQETAAYCAGRPTDQGCALLTVLFERPVNAVVEVDLMTSAKVELGVKITAAGCGCACPAGSEVEVLSSSRVQDRASFVLQTHGLARGLEICAQGDNGYTVIAALDVIADSSLFNAEGVNSPCNAPACKGDGFSSEACANVIGDYCSSVVDPACALVELVFERQVGSSTSLAIFQRGLSPDATVFFVPSRCECSDECGATDVRVETISVDEHSGMVMQLEPATVGVFRMCIGDRSVALLRTSPAACPFDSDGPCNEAVCDDLASEMCMQVIAEYCVHRGVKDAACAFLLPRFVRSVGEQSLSLAVKGPSVPVVRFVTGDCDCTDCSADVQLLATSYDASSQRLDIDFDAKTPTAGVQACDGGVAIAVMDFSTGDCLFKVDSGSPCFVAECMSDATSPLCMHAMLSYCETAVDEACAFLRPVFTSKVGEPLVIPAKVSGAEFGVYPEMCLCDASCGFGPAQNGLVVTADNLVDAVTIVATNAGSIRVCKDATTLALARFTTDGCAFEAGPSSPCSSDVCMSDDVESCLQYTAQYCATRNDQACSLFGLRFERVMGQLTEIAFHNPGLSPSSMSASFVPLGADCSAKGLKGFAVQGVTFQESIVTVEFMPSTVGSYSLCIAGTEIAEVAVLPGDMGSLFGAIFGVPCSAEVCLNADGEMTEESIMSESCMQYTAEYCLAQGADGACAFVIPQYKRQAAVPTIMRFRESEVKFTTSDCGCGCSAAPQVLIKEQVAESGQLMVEFTPAAGTYTICNGATPVAELQVSPSSCKFAEESGPCTSDACLTDEFSANCMEVTMAHCRDHPSDAPCAFFVPIFYAKVDEPSELMLIMPEVVSPSLAPFFGTCCEEGCDTASSTVSIDLVSSSIIRTELYVNFVPRSRFWSSAKLCLAGEHLATVEMEAGECPFSLDKDESPCSNPLCYGPLASAAECSQITAEYCANTDVDTGCALYIPVFEVAVKEAQELTFHVPGGVTAHAQVRFISITCTCGEFCAREEYLTPTTNTLDGDSIIVKKVEAVESAGLIVLDVLPVTLGSYHLCVAPYGAATSAADLSVLVADVTVTESSCLFDLGAAPCMADVCVSQPASEECMQLIAEYCSQNSDDEMCAHLLYAFERPAGEVVSLSLHSAAVLPGTSAWFAASLQLRGMRIWGGRSAKYFLQRRWRYASGDPWARSAKRHEALRLRRCADSTRQLCWRPLLVQRYIANPMLCRSVPRS
jgi:hypothetical protein